MNVYLDTEFTGLTQPGRLMSIALLSDAGYWFYAELNDYGPVNPWIERNVEAYMFVGDLDALRAYSRSLNLSPNGGMIMLGASREQVAGALTTWLAVIPDRVVIWSDVLAYDWLHFCELFGGALKLPVQVYYIPFDLATLLLTRGHDPDVNREEFAGLDLPVTRKHNALWDALVLKSICDKIGLPNGRLVDQPAES